MVVARVTDVRGQRRIRAGCDRCGCVSSRVHRVQVAVRGCNCSRSAGIGCEVVHGCDSRCGWRGNGRLCGQLGTFVPTGRQEISQLGLVPPVHSLRRWLAGECRRHHGTCETIAVRKVAVGQTGVEVAHFEVHCSFTEKVPAFFLPDNFRTRLKDYFFGNN